MAIAPRRKAAGQSLIETLVGIIFMIPVVLFLIDVGVVVLGNMANDHLAKQAARAAASAAPGTQVTAVTSVIQRNQAVNKGFIKGSTGEWIYYDGACSSLPGSTGGTPQPPNPGSGFVAVVTSMQIEPPVPFPFIGGIRTFFAKDVEPIVNQPATPQTGAAY